MLSLCSTILVFNVPELIAQQLEISLAHRAPLGEETGAGWIDVHFGSGFERVLQPTHVPAFNAYMRSGVIQTTFREGRHAQH